MAVTGRRMRMAVALLTVVAGVALVSPADAEDPPVTIAIELERSSSYTYDHVTLHGQVTPGDATDAVILQRFVDGTWMQRGVLRLRLADGRFEFDVNPHEPGPYRLRVRSGGGTVVSNEVALDVTRHPTEIKGGTSTDQAVAGQRIAVRGWVVEPRATPRVVVQRRIGGRWHDRDGGKVDGSGNFTITIAPSQAGRYELRIRSAQGTRWSPTFVLHVSPRPVP